MRCRAASTLARTSRRESSDLRTAASFSRRSSSFFSPARICVSRSLRLAADSTMFDRSDSVFFSISAISAASSSVRSRLTPIDFASSSISLRVLSRFAVRSAAGSTGVETASRDPDACPPSAVWAMIGTGSTSAAASAHPAHPGNPAEIRFPLRAGTLVMKSGSPDGCSHDFKLICPV